MLLFMLTALPANNAVKLTSLKITEKLPNVCKIVSFHFWINQQHYQQQGSRCSASIAPSLPPTLPPTHPPPPTCLRTRNVLAYIRSGLCILKLFVFTDRAKLYKTQQVHTAVLTNISHAADATLARRMDSFSSSLLMSQPIFSILSPRINNHTTSIIPGL